MPREVDNIAIHKAIFARWMKSAEWAMIDVGMRVAAAQYVKFLTDKEAERAAKNAQLQSAQASAHGGANAAKNPAEPMPSLPNPTPADNPRERSSNGQEAEEGRVHPRVPERPSRVANPLRR
jgi:hypothetical protein